MDVPGHSWNDGERGLGGTGYFLNNILYDAVDFEGAEAIYPPSVPADYTLVYDPDHTITTDGALQNSAGSIVNEDPLFADYAHDDFSLSTGSPAIDAGGHLTTVAPTDSGSGTSLIVAEPWFFQDGWAGVASDWIAVGAVNNTAQISAIDYGTGVITLATAVSRSSGDPVYLTRDSDGTQVLNGPAPDIGGVESGGSAGGSGGGAGAAGSGGGASGGAGAAGSGGDGGTGGSAATGGTAGGMSGGSSGAGANAGSAGAPTGAAPESSDEGGCGCRVAASRRSAWLGIASLIAMWTLGLRRRKRQGIRA